MIVERHSNDFQVSDTGASVMTIGELHYGYVSPGK